jgi:hypothetical protein
VRKFIKKLQPSVKEILSVKDLLAQWAEDPSIFFRNYSEGICNLKERTLQEFLNYANGREESNSRWKFTTMFWFNWRNDECKENEEFARRLSAFIPRSIDENLGRIRTWKQFGRGYCWHHQVWYCAQYRVCNIGWYFGYVKGRRNS